MIHITEYFTDVYSCLHYISVSIALMHGYGTQSAINSILPCVKFCMYSN